MQRGWVNTYTVIITNMVSGNSTEQKIKSYLSKKRWYAFLLHKNPTVAFAINNTKIYNDILRPSELIRCSANQYILIYIYYAT